MNTDQTPIHVPEGLTKEQVLSFKPFKNWFETLSSSLALQSSSSHPFHDSPYSLRSVTVQSYDLFGAGRIGFLKMTASVANDAGESLPAAALLRGPSVAMLVMLIPEDDDHQSKQSDETQIDKEERYAVLTVQPRVPAGSLAFVELPAGMVDDHGSFRGAAAKEIEEELGITIHESELVCLSELAAEDTTTTTDQDRNENGENLAQAMFPSAGGCDEHITIYSHERRIPRSQLQEWNGRLTGLRSQGEKITLKVVPMKDLWRVGARDAKALAALALWEGLRREGKV